MKEFIVIKVITLQRKLFSIIWVNWSAIECHFCHTWAQWRNWMFTVDDKQSATLGECGSCVQASNGRDRVLSRSDRSEEVRSEQLWCVVVPELKQWGSKIVELWWSCSNWNIWSWIVNKTHDDLTSKSGGTATAKLVAKPPQGNGVRTHSRHYPWIQWLELVHLSGTYQFVNFLLDSFIRSVLNMLTDLEEWQ